MSSLINMTSSDMTGVNYTKKLYFDPNADEPKEDGYWITDDELRYKLTNLVDVSENIDEVLYYTNPLHRLIPSDWEVGKNKGLHHAFIVFKTKNWWWSIEKNAEGLTIQRAKQLESVRDVYRRAKRTTGETSSTNIILKRKSSGCDMKINELINYIWRKDSLNKVYFIKDSNCQEFAKFIFERISGIVADSKSKNLCELDVYFDSAADEPSGLISANKGFIITVDELLSRVHDLSSSETLVEIEVYKAAINSWQMVNNRMYHLFVIFKTDQNKYWSIERWPNRFTIQRAKNKDILVNECERETRPGNWFTPVTKQKSSNTKTVGLTSVMDFIWKRDKIGKYRMWSNNSHHFADEVYQEFSLFKMI